MLSDYAKGVVTPEIARHAIAAARAAGVPVIVDPKQRTFEAYRGATVITPNLHELDAAAPGAHRRGRRRAPAALARWRRPAHHAQRRRHDAVPRRRTRRSTSARSRKEVFDVTGAGDTVVATLALALGARISIEQAIELASVAAAISVSKRGTATVSPAELLAALDD